VTNAQLYYNCRAREPAPKLDSGRSEIRNAAGPFSSIKICANKKIGEERRGDYPEAGINLEYEGKTNLK